MSTNEFAGTLIGNDSAPPVLLAAVKNVLLDVMLLIESVCVPVL